MARSESQECCRGSRTATQQGDFTQETVRRACRDGIRAAIETQLDDDGADPIVIDGLPTIGKTHQATSVAADLDIPIAILTHRYETRDDHLVLADQFDDYVAEIPTFDRTCPTKRNEHSDRWAERLTEYRNRGASPTYLHYRFQDSLPCMRDGDCQYLRQWEEVESASVIIGGPAHAGLERVTNDRVVIFDEDPGKTYRTEFDGDQLPKTVSAFLSAHEELPINNHTELLMVANNDSFEEQERTIREVLTERDRLNKQSEAIREDGGHAEAPTAVYALLELDGPTVGEDPEDHDWDDELRSEAELDYAELPDGAHVVYDHAESRLIIRRSPDLSDARAVVGLDGTPVEQLWRGRLGTDTVDCRRILCDDCRERYLTEVIGYTFVQTTDAVKPYSSGTYVNRRADYGLIEKVATHHNTSPGVVTTRSAEKLLFENPPDEDFIDSERVIDKIADWKHYGNLRSSNDFVGLDVGVVLGSPHPGDRPIQITAALEGYTAVRDEETKGRNLDYGVPDQPFLRHYREHKVAQAVLRFGRTSPATVYIHTSVMPEWLANMVDSGPDEITIDERGDGERALIQSLIDTGPGTAGEIASRDTIPIGEKHTRDCLKRLRQNGVVDRDDTQPYTWHGVDLTEIPHTARVVLPESEGQES